MPNWSEDGFNKILDAAKRGREKIIANSKEEYERKKEAYEQNPHLCKCCENPLTYSQVLNLSTYCSRSCAAKVNNQKRAKKGTDSICTHCGINFRTVSGGSGKFCSHACSCEHKSKERMQLWLNGEAEIGDHALRKYMAILHPHECAICGISEWNGLPAPLEVDHIDGNPKDNSPGNLRRICPNCHAQTDTYKSKNRGNGRDYRRQRWQEGKTV